MPTSSLTVCVNGLQGPKELNREREGLKLETKQMWSRYEQRRALELERVAKAIRDAKAKVRGLEEDYVSYKNRGAALGRPSQEDWPVLGGLVCTSPASSPASSPRSRASAAAPRFL